MITPVRLQRGSGDDRVAVVSVEPSSSGPDLWLVRVARGVRVGALSQGGVYGPYASAVVEARFAEAVASLRAEGFELAGHGDAIAALASKDRGARARAAVALGWRQDRAAVPALLAAAASAKDEMPLIVEALGRIGDPRAIPLAREQASRKLLSRRRAAVEALRSLGDAEGLADARNAGLERLPEPVRTALATLDENDLRKSQLAPALAVVEALPLERRAPVVDVLYELATPACVALARTLLRAMPIEKPHAWRYGKSVWKRAMVRGDASTFGMLTHAIDVARHRTRGTKAELKSGLDGEEKVLRVFGPSTQRWAVRAAWRHLRKLAKWRPASYARTAAEVLVRYTDADLARWSESFLFHRIVHARSKRIVATRRMKVAWADAGAAKTAPAPREEAYAELWDATPEAYLRVLEGRATPVLDFALAGLGRHPTLVARIESATLADLAASTHDGVVALATKELERRFDPAAPDVKLLGRLLDHDSAEVRARGADLARRSAAAWLRAPSAAASLLARSTAAGRAVLASIAAEAAPRLDAPARESLAAALIDHVRSFVAAREGDAVLDPDVLDRVHAHVEVVRRALVRESARCIPEDEALAWLDRDLTPLRVLGAVRMLESPAALDRVGLPRVERLALDPLVALRTLGHLLLRDALPRLRTSPAPLFTLVESTHADTREAAFDLLRAIDATVLGLDGVSALCDSGRAEVQAFGRELVERHPEAFDLGELLFRLSESPHASMRRFALDLADTNLRHGLVPLMRLDAFVRAVLLDLHPDRQAKRRLVDLVVARGLETEDQAAHVAALLSSVVRTKTISDFDRILAGLARLGAAHPGIASDVRLVPGAST